MKLLLGNCLEEMKKLDDCSISLFIMDLPFNITHAKWDLPIDLNKLWILIKKKMKPDANIIFFGTAKFGYKLIDSNPNWFSYDLIWEKSRPTGHLNSKVAFLRKHENLYIFKDKSAVYNPQMVLRDKPIIQRRKKKKRDGLYNEYYDIEERLYTHKYPVSILKFASVHKPIHSTEKPLSLLEYLIKTYSNEEDVVLDPTCGSGSTGVACRNTGRKFIGIELDEKYFNLAKKRIDEI